MWVRVVGSFYWLILFVGRINGSGNVGALPSSHVEAGLKNNLVMYSDIIEVNTTDSLDRLRRVPMYFYQFKFDSIKDRRHMGVLPADAARYFPEAVDIVQRYTLPPREKGSDPIVLNNFPVVDKNALMIHGLAAFQGLIKHYDALVADHQKLVSQAEQAHASTQVVVDKALHENELKKKEFLLLLKSVEDRVDRWEQSVDKAWTEYNAEMQKVAAAELDLARLTAETVATKESQDKAAALQQLEGEKAVLELQQQLARQRLEMEHELAKAALLAQEGAKREEDSARQAAALRTLEKRAALDKELLEKKAELEKDKVRTEALAKAEAERANEDIAVRKLELKSRLDLERQKDAIRQVGEHVLRLVQDIISQPQRVAALLGALLAFIAAYYAVREFISAVREIIQTQLGKPLLVRETSIRTSWLPKWLSFSESLVFAKGRIEQAFAAVILAPQDRDQILQLALATRNTKSAGAPYRHVLLHGPPGTGKTLVARRLAESSGMDYAIMSGGDVGPLGEDAVSQLHKLFRWAARSRSGLLLFIDEAEAFLGSRGTMGGAGVAGGDSAHLRNALNALLYQTGTQSRNFLLVLATNRPEDLDSAVLDRIDVTVRLGLPGAPECAGLCKLYMDKSVTQYAAKTQKSLFSSNHCRVENKLLEDKFMHFLADRVVGFSGREISKLFVTLQYEMLLAPSKTLTEEIVRKVMGEKLREHQDKTAYDVRLTSPVPVSSPKAGGLKT